MPDYVHYFNLFTGTGVILLQILSVAALFMLCFGPRENKLLALISRHALAIGFVISLAAVLTSLVYSEVIGWAPCFLCWLDRVFIAPQAVIFAVALARKDRGALGYTCALTVLGLINALYHMYIYTFGEGTGPCDASGVSCVQKLVYEYGGYISIPMNALSGFFALFVLCLVAWFYRGNALPERSA